MAEPSKISSRFSLAAFQKCKSDLAASEELARQLQNAIAAELEECIRAAAQKIALQLNESGHNCKEYSTELLDDGHLCVTCLDDELSDDAHRLRFNLDLVVSSGFAVQVPDA